MIIGALTLLVASAAVYGIFVNNQIQAKPEQNTTAPDYSSQLDSIKSQMTSLNSQINSISSSLTALDTLKNNVADIQTKLNDIEDKGTLTQQPTPTVSLTVVLDKSAYALGDTMKITAVGATPLKSAQIELLDNSGFVIIHRDTLVDSSGKIAYDLSLSNSLSPGSYRVQVVSDQQTQSQLITIGTASTTQNNPSTGSTTFTAQTDKSSYQQGDLVQVIGTGTVGSAVTATMSSPTGKTYTSAVTIQGNGNYAMIFSLSSTDENGTWNITVTNLGQSKSLSISVGGTTGSNTLTAQADNSVYQRGDIVSITGTGTANTSITGVMTGPSGTTHNTSTTIQSNGSYVMRFSTTSTDPIGNWQITITNSGQSKTLSVYIQ